MSFVRYPPGRANVWIPVGDARSAAAGLSLLTFSKPLPLLAQRTLHRAVRIAGPWLLPGRREKWEPPVDGWDALLAEVAEAVGRVDGVALYLRPQSTRPGAAALLLRDGRPVGFLKVREGLEREAGVLRLLDGGDGFRAPVVLGEGHSWLVMSAMEPVPARPARKVDVVDLTARIQRLLADLPKPPGTPGHWLPMHGDLTPWNLRRTRGRVPWLIDWEDAAWAPPGADEVYFRAAETTLFGVDPVPTGYAEAAAHWEAVISKRHDDLPLNGGMLAALEVLSRPPSR
ncbi:phosphotransferase [Herbidospora cretacea]|uniref:phosphotransferase n=1 Tax=Herbidospora cretacea TaxID=28444 RepID=UPI0007737FB4|nr:phosphotransferase [Herbidospora cretacea]